MPISATIRLQIEAALAHKVPSALTPAPRVIRPVAAKGIGEMDDRLHGGLPVGLSASWLGRSARGGPRWLFPSSPVSRRLGRSVPVLMARTRLILYQQRLWGQSRKAPHCPPAARNCDGLYLHLDGR